MSRTVKILQVNNVYGEKSTGKLTMELHHGLLRAGHESLVVFGRGSGKEEPGVIRLCPEWYGKANGALARLTGLSYGGCLLSTQRLMGIIRREKPDVVHLQCINGSFVNIYRLIRWLKRKRVKTLVSLHAEFMYTGNCGHAFDCDQWKTGCRKCPDKKKATKSWFFDRTGTSWKRMRDAFSGFEEDCIIAPVSGWTESRAKESDILKNFTFTTVFNGVNTDVFRPAVENGKKDKPAVLNVTARFSPDPNHPKGGWYLVELAKRMPDVAFFVAGPGTAPENCPENLHLLGVIGDQRELAAWYSQADLSVVVSRRETFSMPCAESLCCGTPVVGFEAGAPEQISLPQYSEFVPFGDLDALENMIRKWLTHGEDRDAIAAAGAETYSSETMIRNFTDVYRRLLWKLKN